MGAAMANLKELARITKTSHTANRRRQNKTSAIDEFGEMRINRNSPNFLAKSLKKGMAKKLKEKTNFI